MIPYFARAGRLVLRNASADGPSHGWCRLLGATAEMPPHLESETIASPGCASFLATQINASALALAGADASDTTSSGVIAKIGEAAEQLRTLLGRADTPRRPK